MNGASSLNTSVGASSVSLSFFNYGYIFIINRIDVSMAPAVPMLKQARVQCVSVFLNFCHFIESVANRRGFPMVSAAQVHLGARAR